MAPGWRGLAIPAGIWAITYPLGIGPVHSLPIFLTTLLALVVTFFIGKALSFLGLADSVNVVHQPALASYPMTVATWFKTTSTTGVRGIVNKYTAGSFNGYQVFLANGNLLRTWMTPRPGNLTDRLAKLPKPGDVADELYLSVLTRRPTAEERREVIEYVEKRPQDRPAALQELVWALLTSAEFRFNH